MKARVGATITKERPVLTVDARRAGGVLRPVKYPHNKVVATGVGDPRNGPQGTTYVYELASVTSLV